MQLGRTAQGVAVDLQHLLQGHGVSGWVKVADVGQQKFKRVADAAVGVHHTGEDFVVDAQVARVVSRGAPQADDLCAQLVADLLGRNHIALALAHLAALAVHGEAVREQALVGRVVVHGAGGEQRAVEPAAMLVVAFQVQVGRPGGLGGMAVAQHVVMRGAGVKPHVQNVGALGVVRCILTDDGFNADLAPSLHATGLHHGSGLVHDVHGARVQLAAVFVDEEGQRHAPVALAADAPVGPTGNHVAQADFAVLGVEAGFFDGGQGELAQGLCRLVLGEDPFTFVHAHKPLRSGAVDHRRFVTPAVRVAVRDVVAGEESPGIAQGFDDHRHGFPDVLAAEQGEVGLICPVALHRVQDVVVFQAVRHAAVEVFHAVSGCGVDNAGAVGVSGVVGQVDGREATVALVHVVQRVLEMQQTEIRAFGGGHDFAFELVTLQAFLDQRGGQHQVAAWCLHQRVVQVRVQVERLVGGQGPGGGGPDHGEGRCVDCGDAKGSSKLVEVRALKAHI